MQPVMFGCKKLFQDRQYRLNSLFICLKSRFHSRPWNLLCPIAQTRLGCITKRATVYFRSKTCFRQSLVILSIYSLAKKKRSRQFQLKVRSEIGQVQKSDRINSDRQSGSDQFGSTRINSDQLGSTRIVSDHEKNIKLNEIETFTHLKVKIPVKNGPN